MRIHLLGEIIAGILHSGESRVSHIAQGVNEGRRKQESVKKQISRFLSNEHINKEQYYLPFAREILKVLSKCHQELIFAIDGSVVGSGCMALMISVIYKGRAIPIVWQVYRRKKGHFPEQVHRDLLLELKELVPCGTRVCILGDGEFDGCDWQSDIAGYGWDYVLRTGKNTLIEDEHGDSYSAGSILVDQGEEMFIESIQMGKKRYGPINLFIWHESGHEEGLIFVTNLDYSPQIKSFYIKRYLIETFFRDSKSKGFNIHKSGLRCPEKLNRLLITTCIAYLLCILAGIKALKSKFYDLVSEQSKEALSLFQIGFRFIRKLVDLRQWRAFSWNYDMGLSFKT